MAAMTIARWQSSSSVDFPAGFPITQVFWFFLFL